MAKVKEIAQKKSSKFLFNAGLMAGAVVIAYICRCIYNSATPKPFPFACLPPNGAHLLQIARPRPSGSTGSVEVQDYLISQFNSKHWHFERDSHTAEATPAGPLTFTNLIFTSKTPPSATRKRIMIAAHYDSKVLEAHGRQDSSPEEILSLLQQSKFIGATDSAFSCALMISLAQELESLLLTAASPFSLQFVFFDGEEAMIHWSPSDSLYGSKHLAATWAESGNLQGIELMILLDLLGSARGQVHSFHPPGTALHNEFQKLRSIEHRLFHSNLLFSDSQQYAQLRGFGIEDDHIPFQQRGVPVLHLIPIPFPSVWHTEGDTIEALDRESCTRIAQVMLEYLKEKLLE